MKGYVKGFSMLFDEFQRYVTTMAVVGWEDAPARWRKVVAWFFDEYMRAGLVEAEAIFEQKCAARHARGAIAENHPRLLEVVRAREEEQMSAADKLSHRFRLRAGTLFVRFLACLTSPPPASVLYQDSVHVSEERKRNYRRLSDTWDQQVDCAAVSALLVNDLYGMARDVSRNEDAFNYTLGLGRAFHLGTLERTLGVAVSLHDRCLTEVAKTAPWLLGLVTGYALWHDGSPRYRREAVAAESNGIPIRFDLECRTDAFVVPSAATAALSPSASLSSSLDAQHAGQMMGQMSSVVPMEVSTHSRTGSNCSTSSGGSRDGATAVIVINDSDAVAVTTSQKKKKACVRTPKQTRTKTPSLAASASSSVGIVSPKGGNGSIHNQQHSHNDTSSSSSGDATPRGGTRKRSATQRRPQTQATSSVGHASPPSSSQVKQNAVTAYGKPKNSAKLPSLITSPYSNRPW